MLAELRVRDLGVIAELTLVLGTGMTALTGETGAGKTLVVEAIELLLGGRADPVLVRPGAAEASVEGRFVGLPRGAAGDARAGDGDAGVVAVPGDGGELVLARTVPASGRSRGYIDGRLATLGALETTADELVDLHGQHSHQSLLAPAAQRAGLDDFAGIDHGPRDDARKRLRDATDAMGRLGGDARARARELDVLRFQVDELAAAKVTDAGEDERLAGEEERLADATAHRDTAIAALQALGGEDGVADGLGRVVASLSGRRPLDAVLARLRAIAVDLDDTASELRMVAEGLEDDPARLAEVRTRRQLLRELRRKYGETLAEVITYAEQARGRLGELESYEEQAAAYDRERAVAAAELEAAEVVIGALRRAAAPKLAAAVEEQLRALAMPKARFEVVVGPRPPGDDVTWLLGANPGEPALPLAKVASGGELARTMLAVRLVLGPGGAVGEPGRTLVFDEVDAGIGGEAALAVGRALAALGRDHQVLVVTHLPQVAAFARQQVAVRKEEDRGRTVATAQTLDPDERIVELSRMLSGQPDSAAARRHAEELLAFTGIHR